MRPRRSARVRSGAMDRKRNRSSMLAFTAAGVTTGARVGDARASPPGDAAIALDGTGLYAASVPLQRAIY